ncbi:hypothetical protein Xen7305DRAFT_00008160 [Xenococcus sp. PCC 7305]|uniref:hypothetical protein n=1 Tax=Xenococcus sp. PCC 7305 TaxID=102125 RepID=UPI0002ABED35|nr:hypothetical protein [Xenococcus sp. PCC 7305]ELS01114.1 hypothetical protein Xen7305DRAFT_00008160 [Xenococcus sp. PCC 7305]
MSSSFSTIPLTRKSNYDAATVLREVSEAPISAATNGTPLGLLRWHRHGEYKCVINSYAYSSYVAGSAEWVISIEVANDTGSTYAEIASTVVPGVATTSEIPLSGELVNQALVDEVDPVIRVVATPTGSPGDLTYGAFLTCV